MTTEAKDKTDSPSENELIAEFMGVKKGPFGGLQYPQFRYIETSSGWCDEPSHYEYKTEYKPNQLKYHESWDWLMPVIHNIEHELSKRGASRKGGWHFWNDQFDGRVNTDIQVAHDVVVEFIRWYNANQPKS